MTTQELKQYIDKVLGNNIRCLLPSYWWKRLFNQVADRVDEVEQSTTKLVESKVEEVKMPIVESVDELEKLKLAKGRVAAVEKTGEFATVKISDCYFSLNWEEDWSKYTIVKGVEEKDNVITDNDAAVLFSASKEMVTKDALQVNKLKSGTFCYTKWTDDEMRFSSLEEVNKALSSGKYRAINYVNGSDDYFIDDYFTFYSEKPQPSLYIKGDSWERLAKDYTASSREALNSLNAPVGSIAKVASEYSIVNVEDCYLPNGENIVAEWDKLTPIRKVEVLGYDGSNFCNILLSAKVNDFGDYISVTYDNNNYVYSKGSFVDQTSTELSKSELDALLLERDYRYAANLTQGELTVDSVFTLYTDSSTADAYIKGDSWTRLLKEGDATGGDDRVLLSSSEEAKVENAKVYNKIKSGIACNPYLSIYIENKSIVTTICAFNYSEDTDSVTLQTEYVSENEGSCSFVREFYSLASDGTIGFLYEEKEKFPLGGSGITVDSELSTTSINAVQNKVITAALNNKADKTYVDSAIAEAITNTINTPV